MIGTTQTLEESLQEAMKKYRIREIHFEPDTTPEEREESKRLLESALWMGIIKHDFDIMGLKKTKNDRKTAGKSNKSNL
jgi:hypothetical protein